MGDAANSSLMANSLSSTTTLPPNLPTYAHMAPLALLPGPLGMTAGGLRLPPPHGGLLVGPHVGHQLPNLLSQSILAGLQSPAAQMNHLPSQGPAAGFFPHGVFPGAALSNHQQQQQQNNQPHQAAHSNEGE